MKKQLFYPLQRGKVNRWIYEKKARRLPRPINPTKKPQAYPSLETFALISSVYPDLNISTWKDEWMKTRPTLAERDE